MVERHECRFLVAHDVALEPPREPGSDVVPDGGAGWDGKNIVELLQCSLFGLWYK